MIWRLIERGAKRRTAAIAWALSKAGMMPSTSARNWIDGDGVVVGGGVELHPAAVAQVTQLRADAGIIQARRDRVGFA